MVVILFSKSLDSVLGTAYLSAKGGTPRRAITVIVGGVLFALRNFA